MGLIRYCNMKKHDEFVAYLLELMQPLGPVSAKAMFGGYGIYIDGLMFALVANDVLYLKTDATSRPDFEQHNLPPFRYERNGRMISMSYSEAPAEIMEDIEAMKRWCNKAMAAALKNRSRE
jgi:DNA transformation protein